MIKNAIIIHGMPYKWEYESLKHPSPSNSHWLPGLQKHLLTKGVLAQTPEFPKPYSPDYKEWLELFKQYNVDNETILIGHSCGAGFLIRWLSENDVKVGKVVLVALWLDPKESLKNSFFKFELDKNLKMKTDGITLFNSDNDEDEVQESVKLLCDKVSGIKYIEVNKKGHFNITIEKFPELLEEVLPLHE